MKSHLSCQDALIVCSSDELYVRALSANAYAGRNKSHYTAVLIESGDV